MNVNLTTLLMEDLTHSAATELISLSTLGQVDGKCDFDNPLVEQWFEEVGLDVNQRLLTYTTVFLARAALSAALFFQGYDE